MNGMDHSTLRQSFFTVVMLLIIAGTAYSQDKTFVNNLGMAFTLIPAGTFIMGSPVRERQRDAGETPHRVTISRPFYMQTTEVTIGQWRKVTAKGLLGFFKRRKGRNDLPVSRTCYYDTKSFIEKLNAMDQGRYRLPTEAEWEYAARAGTTTAYSWGDHIDCSLAMFANKKGRFDRCRATAKGKGLPLDGPAPVKSFPPNPWGLYDMHGNVWEWCRDWFGPYQPGAQTDPQGPANATNRVRRGGSWFGEGEKCRSANRAYGHPGSRLRNTGFRVVRIIQTDGR
jgi:formylglycine-generating enzyme required for sulfatase activity